MNEQNNKIHFGSTIIYWAIIIFVFGFIIAIIVPNLAKPRASNGTPAGFCVNNLRQLEAAANQFALEHNLTNGDRINFPNDLTPYIKLNSTGKIPPCPSGGIYYVGRVGKAPICSLGTTVTPAHVLQ